jgi:hypothetical protein
MSDLKQVENSALMALYQAAIALRTMHRKEGLKEYEEHYKERSEAYRTEIMKRLERSESGRRDAFLLETRF